MLSETHLPDQRSLLRPSVEYGGVCLKETFPHSQSTIDIPRIAMNESIQGSENAEQLGNNLAIQPNDTIRGCNGIELQKTFSTY